MGGKNSCHRNNRNDRKWNKVNLLHRILILKANHLRVETYKYNDIRKNHHEILTYTYLSPGIMIFRINIQKNFCLNE